MILSLQADLGLSFLRGMFATVNPCGFVLLPMLGTPWSPRIRPEADEVPVSRRPMEEQMGEM